MGLGKKIWWRRRRLSVILFYNQFSSISSYGKWFYIFHPSKCYGHGVQLIYLGFSKLP